MKHSLIAAALAVMAAAASAQTTVKDAWIRATVAQQKSTAMFGQIVSTGGGRLVGASSPVAGIAEVHEMAMEGDVMKMRALSNGLSLPAGKTVTLEPRSVHLMLLDLKQPLKAGDVVPVTLVIEGADKKRETVELKVPVMPLAP